MAAARQPTKRSVVYANSALTAIDNIYIRLGLDKIAIEHGELPQSAPRALDETCQDPLAARRGGTSVPL